jgi:hypothetical protein
MHKQLAVTALFCGLMVAFAPSAHARATGQSTDHQRIKALEARVAELERRQGIAEKAATTAAAAAPVAAATPAAVPMTPAPAAQAAQVAPAPAVAQAPATPADWSALHRGMNPREVLAVLGNPLNKQIRPLLEIWYYPDDRSVQFDRDSRLESWTGQ